MCTVTIVPLGQGSGFRMAVNRDESRARAEARGPEVRRFGDRSAILPIDPVAGGTGVAASAAGLALTLLNYYSVSPAGRSPAAGRTPGAKTARASRGLVIPALLGAGSLDEAVALARGIDPAPYPPYRLVATDGRGVVEVRHD